MNHFLYSKLNNISNDNTNNKVNCVEDIFAKEFL